MLFVKLSQEVYTKMPMFPSEDTMLKLPNHFVLPIANPFLSCPVAVYVNRPSNKRSLLNKRTINFFFIE